VLLAIVVALLQMGASVNPYDVYARAQAFWGTQPYAAYLTYDVAVTVRQGDRWSVERYNTLFDATAAKGAIYVDEVSDYELTTPVMPTGVNVCILVACVSKPLPPIDFIGIPELTPTYSFQMAPFVRVAPPNREESREELPLPSTSTEKPPTIARVVAKAIQPYIISFAGEENVNGHACYHLTLQPRADPGRYRLRALWIDRQTGATRRLRVALNFVSGPGTASSWTVDFANVGDVQYIARETAERPLRYDGRV
jgi:hypothetical protein